MKNIAKTKNNLKKCICLKCPSYTFNCKLRAIPGGVAGFLRGLDKSQHFEGLFCAFEKSRCLSQEKGCICGRCEVFKENNLNKYYFCLANEGK